MAMFRDLVLRLWAPDDHLHRYHPPGLRRTCAAAPSRCRARSVHTAASCAPWLSGFGTGAGDGRRAQVVQCWRARLFGGSSRARGCIAAGRRWRGGGSCRGSRGGEEYAPPLRRGHPPARARECQLARRCRERAGQRGTRAALSGGAGRLGATRAGARLRGGSSARASGPHRAGSAPRSPRRDRAVAPASWRSPHRGESGPWAARARGFARRDSPRWHPLLNGVRSRPGC